jgi:hypothetical protein
MRRIGLSLIEERRAMMATVLARPKESADYEGAMPNPGKDILSVLGEKKNHSPGGDD